MEFSYFEEPVITIKISGSTKAEVLVEPIVLSTIADQSSPDLVKCLSNNVIVTVDVSTVKSEYSIICI